VRSNALTHALHRNGSLVDHQRVQEVMSLEATRWERVWRERWVTLRNPERVAWMLQQLELPALSAALTADVCRAFDESLWEAPPEPNPGAREALQSLKNMGVELAVISDTSYSTGKMLRKLLERYHLLEFFDCLTFSDEVGISKPNAEMFLATLRALRVGPAFAVHVGDNPFTDVFGANEAGLRSVAFGSPCDEATWNVEALSELPALLKPLVAARLSPLSR